MAKKNKAGNEEGLKNSAPSKGKKSAGKAGLSELPETSSAEKPAPRIRKRAAARKPTRAPRTATAKSTETSIVIQQEQIELRAYYISERRRNMGWPGDSNSDWIEAERQLRKEAAKSAFRQA
jgi:hypothetical protein